MKSDMPAVLRTDFDPAKRYFAYLKKLTLLNQPYQ
jgi:hypothetical protein